MRNTSLHPVRSLGALACKRKHEIQRCKLHFPVLPQRKAAKSQSGLPHIFLLCLPLLLSQCMSSRIMITHKEYAIIKFAIITFCMILSITMVTTVNYKSWIQNYYIFSLFLVKSSKNHLFSAQQDTQFQLILWKPLWYFMYTISPRLCLEKISSVRLQQLFSSKHYL